MKRFYLYITVIIIASVFYFSCESSVENKIDGTWCRINVQDMSSEVYEEWTLKDGFIYMINIQADTILDTLNYGNYNIKIKRLKRYLCLSECSNSKYDGEYKIDKLNSKYFVIVGDMVDAEYYEFVKK